MTQYLATLLSLTGLLGIRRKELWGPVVGASGSLAWAGYGIATEQYGLMLTEVVFAVTYALVFLEWMADQMSQVRPGGL